MNERNCSDIYLTAPFNLIPFIKVTLARACLDLKSYFKEPYRKS